MDACAVDEDATIVAGDGELRREPFHADSQAPIDCFYVYPTVSYRQAGNADMTIGPEERRAVAQQFARFGSKCRLFAPVYRQVTLKALLTSMGANPIPFSREIAYAGLLAAWRSYLAQDNKGRGFVLVGHSQGASLLADLIRDEIDGHPIQDRMVSAILMGMSLPVRSGVEPELPFPHIPVCRANADLGCVIAFADFRAEAPPPTGSRFVWAPADMKSVCANPAALGGGAGALDAYLATSGATVFGEAARPVVWSNPPRRIDTPFVKLPGLLTARCAEDAHGAYLAVTLHPGPGEARAKDIVGDVIVAGKAQADWGLHLIDANLTIGNLVAVVGDETRAYLARPLK